MSQYRATHNCGIALMCLLMLLTVGCRTEIKSPTPSAYYLHDGPVAIRPDMMLSNQVQALEEYKLEREKLRAAMAEDEE